MNNLFGRIQSVELRHSDVDDHDIGTELGGQLNSLPTIARLSTYLKILAALDHYSNAMTYDLVVVCN
jgi:hypothetical protein